MAGDPAGPRPSHVTSVRDKKKEGSENDIIFCFVCCWFAYFHYIHFSYSFKKRLCSFLDNVGPEFFSFLVLSLCCIFVSLLWGHLLVRSFDLLDVMSTVCLLYVLLVLRFCCFQIN